MGIDWRRLLLAMVVSGIVCALLITLVRPAAIGFFAGLIAAAAVSRVTGVTDGAVVCSVAALPAGVYFGLHAGLGYPIAPGEPQTAILVGAPILGALAYAAVGSLTGAVLGLFIHLAREGRFPFF